MERTITDRLRYLATVLDYSRSIQMMQLDGKEVPIVRIHSNDVRRAAMFAEMFGGELNLHKSGMYVFRRSHGQAVDIVRKVRPYLYLSEESADRVLAWVPTKPRGPAKPIMVPCPNNCGRLKTSRAKQCLKCYMASEDYRKAQFKTDYSPLQKADINQIIEPVSKPGVIVHRIRG